MYIGVIVSLLAAWFPVPVDSGDRLLPARVLRTRSCVLAVLGVATIIVASVSRTTRDCDWMTKLAGQIIAAGIFAWQGVADRARCPIINTLWRVCLSYMSLIFTVLAVVLVMNAVNFIDGLDGLVAGVGDHRRRGLLFRACSSSTAWSCRPSSLLQPAVAAHRGAARGLLRLPHL